MKLTENERKILEVLAEDYDSSGWDETRFWSFAPLERKTGIERRKVRLACRSLARKGLVKYLRGLVDQDGMMAGAGYGATKEGAAFINPCDKCKELATYDWWEKDGQQVLSTEDGSIHIRLCEEHHATH